MADGEYSELRSKVVVTSDTSGLDKVTEGIKEAKQAADDLSKSANTAGSSVGKLGKVGETLEKINDQIGESKTAKFTTSIEDSGLVAQKTLIEDIGERMDELSNKTFDSSNSPARIMTPEMAREIADSTTKLDLLKMKANDATEAYIRLVREGKTGKQVTSALEAMQKATAAYEAELEKVYSHQAHQLVPLISPDQAEEFARQIGETQRLSANLEYAKGKLAGFLDKWAQGDTSSKTAKNIADWSVKVNNLREKLTAAISANTAFASGAGNVASQAGNAAENVNEYANATERLGQAAINAPQENLALPAPTSIGAPESARDEVVSTFAGLNDGFSWLSNIGGAVQSVLGEIASTFTNVASAAGSAASAVGGFAASIGNRVMGSIRSFTKGLGNIINSFKRIAFYRFIRSVIRAITEGFKEGVNNLYQWSKAVNGQFAKSMNTLASSSLYMKNSLGAMVAPLINAIAPAIEYIIDRFVDLLNVVNQVFAILSGASSWTKAKKRPVEYADAVKSGAGKATEALHKLGLAQIDELTILDKNHGDKSGGGGGGSGKDYSDMFETVEQFNKKLQDLLGKMKINFNDVLFKWDNLTPEDIAKKAIAGLSAFLGGAAGFIIGGVPGAIVGTLLGGTLGLMIDSLIFDNDGKLSRNEIGEMLRLALFAIAGGAIGFVLGGPGGALIGATIGVGLFGGIKAFEFFNDTNTDLIQKLMPILGTIGGASIGFKIGGPAGALIGAMIGLGVSMAIETFGFKDTSNWNGWDWTKAIVKCLAPATGAIIGLVVGGPGGAAVGAIIGLGVSFLLDTDIVGKADDYGEKLNDTAKKHTAALESEVNRAGEAIESSTGRHFGGVSTTVANNLVKTATDVDVKSNGIVNTVVGAWNKLKSDTSSTWGDIVGTIGDWIEKAKQKLNFKWSFPKIDLPHIPSPHFSWTTGLAGIPIPHFDGWWAQGGFPQEGSLFIAREAGAEMVGSMGGRTAVANNDQIVEGISQGVYAAVKSALGDGSNSVNVYLDGKQISGTVVSNINSETRRTGSSPLLSF